ADRLAERLLVDGQIGQRAPALLAGDARRAAVGAADHTRADRRLDPEGHPAGVVVEARLEDGAARVDVELELVTAGEEIGHVGEEAGAGEGRIGDPPGLQFLLPVAREARGGWRALVAGAAVREAVEIGGAVPDRRALLVEDAPAEEAREGARLAAPG